jgi:cation transport ATPase
LQWDCRCFCLVSAGASRIWFAATLPVLLGLSVEIFKRLRRGDVGLDVVAAISMSAALIFGENLAAVVVALMYAGGKYLEDFAAHRARREMTALLARTPRSAIRHGKHGLEEIDLDSVQPGDRLLVRQGEVAPVDGTLTEGVAVLDLAALTGESIPIQRRAGESIVSGALNVGGPFDLLATRVAADSTYAGIIKLVEAAQRSKPLPWPSSPLRWPFRLGAWSASNDPIRAVAVLVIATPCPLILAVPIAIVAGLSRAARYGILIKDAAALETMAKIRSIVIDKTGTPTGGRARIVAVNPCSGLSQDELLRLAASLDQASKHIMAQIIVAEARSRKLALVAPVEVKESPGDGLEGVVEGQKVLIGSVRFVQSKMPAIRDALATSKDPAAGALVVAVAVDNSFAGTLVLADELRTGVQKLLLDLKRFRAKPNRSCPRRSPRRRRKYRGRSADRRHPAGIDARPESHGRPCRTKIRRRHDDRRRH